MAGLRAATNSAVHDSSRRHNPTQQWSVRLQLPPGRLCGQRATGRSRRQCLLVSRCTAGDELLSFRSGAQLQQPSPEPLSFHRQRAPGSNHWKLGIPRFVRLRCTLLKPHARTLVQHGPGTANHKSLPLLRKCPNGIY